MYPWASFTTPLGMAHVSDADPPSQLDGFSNTSIKFP